MHPWLQRLAARLRLARPAGVDAGRWGEGQAARFLQARGFRILARNVRVGRRDEIDLLARDGDTLVFVEVKTRGSEDFGRPADAVRGAKRRNLSRAAARYMKKLRRPPDYFRFDIVEVVGHSNGASPDIRHLPNAFTLERPYRVWW